MKVLDLLCDAGHAFEGWFGSEDDYVSQCERGLVECPLCASRGVSRLPSAPRLNLSGSREPVMKAQPQPTTPATTPEPRGVEAMWMRAVRHVMANTEDVGERFADEARRIHYGEVPERGIRGRTTGDEARALRDEGIEVQALAVPEGLKGTVQ
ncbi:MAG: DUF1178 family protein [Methylibium sp.]|nr:DUF1178 family protein [Methylibium sp.]